MHRQPPITVLVARFEDLIAHGLRSLLDTDDHIQTIAYDVEHENLDAALSQHGPHVAVLNFSSLRSAVEIHQLSSAHPATRLLVLASRPTAAECSQTLAFGATACLSKETRGTEILEAVHLASRGIPVAPPTPAPASAEPSGPDVLTPREAEIFEHLRAGASNAQIAHALQVSVETVRTHARSVFRKVGVSNRRELRGMGR